MKRFFEYNWQIRDEWFNWCKQLNPEELMRKRHGGLGSILFTLFHIVDVEYSWIRGIQSKDDLEVAFDEYNTLEKVKLLSDTYRMEIAEYLLAYTEAHPKKN